VFVNPDNMDVNPHAVPNVGGEDQEEYEYIYKKYQDKLCSKLNLAEDGPDEDKEKCHELIEKK